MKINISLLGKTPEEIKAKVEHYLPNRKVTIGKQYGDISCDLEIEPEMEGGLVCSLETLQEMLYEFYSWDIRFW